MKNFLIVVDMQRDFVDKALGTPEAVMIVPEVVRLIESFDGEIIATKDTHFDNYMTSEEGKHLPVPHCIRGTEGWEFEPQVAEALSKKNVAVVEKYTFGSVDLPELIRRKAGADPFSITLIGLCTDICVVSNALLLKAFFPEVEIAVIERACAGVTPALHQAALSTMKSCQIHVI